MISTTRLSVKGIKVMFYKTLTTVSSIEMGSFSVGDIYLRTRSTKSKEIDPETKIVSALPQVEPDSNDPIDLGGSSRMVFRCVLAIEYFNNRKMVLEPFLEPWQFYLKITDQDNIQRILISDSSGKSGSSNDLYINVSTALIETIRSVKNDFLETQNNYSPYKIENEFGAQIRIRLSKTNSDRPTFQRWLPTKPLKRVGRPANEMEHLHDSPYKPLCLNYKHFCELKRHKRLKLISEN